MSSGKNGKGQLQSLPAGAAFINDGATDSDIQQGGLGDCWFLSALASLAVDLPDKFDNTTRKAAAQRVIQKAHNNTAVNENTKNFKFQFSRLGEWHEVTVDDVLPEYRRAQPSHSNEWWVPLTEKAYAQFNQSYDNIEGGYTCWALTELTGGIAVGMDLTMKKINRIGVEEFKAFVKKYLQRNGIFCTSNDGSDERPEANGLIQGHAYSLLSIDDIEVNGQNQTLVRIRNPHGRGEWNGPWSDGSAEWNDVSEEVKKAIKYSENEDGGFFMSFADWVDQYETFTVCYITDDKTKTDE